MSVKVTIIIPTRNRSSVLMNTLEICERLSDPAPEIIVYDDHSDVDYSAEIRGRFARVIFKRSETSVGPCELRNRMISMASGDLIIGLDDDSYFTDAAHYHKSIQLLLSMPEAGLIGFRVRLKEGIQFPSKEMRGLSEACDFLGCGFIGYKKALDAVGGFDPLIFRAGEERDLALRLMEGNYRVWVDPNIEVFHEYTPVARNHQLIHGYAFRNELIFYLKHFPGWRCPAYFIKCLLSHTLFCFKKGWFGVYGNGLIGFFKLLPSVIKRRNPVKKETALKYLALRRVCG